MAIRKIQSGQRICQAGDPLNEFFVIGEGSVQALFPGGELMLQKGDVIGVSDIRSGVHSCTCTAATPAALIPYPYQGLEQLLAFFQTNPNVMHLFFTAGARFSLSLQKHCTAAATAANEKYAELAALLQQKEAQLEEAQSKCSQLETALAQRQLSDENEDEDFMDLSDDDTVLDFSDTEETYEDLPDSIDTSVIIQDDEDTEIPPELSDALSTILIYGNCDEELADRFVSEIVTFKAMPDKDSTQDADRAFRNKLNNDFYKVYKSVFTASLENDSMPPAVKLFLQFGFVDAKLAGVGNSAYLLSIADSFQGAPDRGIYTFYEWLLAIYSGTKEPSRNEFDLDYPAYLREQKNSGNISASDEKRMLSSPIDRVYFELENVFPIVNKMTFGRISTFCPILSSHNLIKPLPQSIVTPQRVIRTLEEIKQIDFSAYCRETTYIDENIGIAREFLQVEVLPDVILMPNAGIRGAMWQEIEGKRRTTPSRMMLSVIGLESIFHLMTRMTGEFRWEMCKRIQGAYWNNIAERSLTSEYTDYAQFYKRNHDLSPEAKEKIKLSLQKSKNSIKEMFIRDYSTWIMYEGKGAPHLNKIARSILFTYCPFPASIRESLKAHPLYSSLIERYQLQTNQKLHHLEMVCSKVEKNGYTVPEEILKQKEHYSL